MRDGRDHVYEAEIVKNKQSKGSQAYNVLPSASKGFTGKKFNRHFTANNIWTLEKMSASRSLASRALD